MRNKLTTVTLLLCAGMVSYAQNYNPVAIPCTKVTPTNMNNFNGTINANCIVDEDNLGNGNSQININGNQNVELKAGEEINLDGEVWVHPNPNGNFYAHIEASEIGLAWYQPYDTPGQALKFDLVEIGVDLPDDINQYVQNYITNSGIIRLNPFNPEQIDVKAEFYRNSSTNGDGTWLGPLKVYGFYYEEFFENTADSNALNWTLDPVVSEHKFRVRFAPPQTGLWRCKITITINANTPQEVVYNASEFTFNVLNSSDPGYVKVGSNKLYMQLGNETYFPIGRNIPQPDLVIYGSAYQAPIIDSLNGYDNRKIHPAYHKAYRDELTDYRNAGGEEFRTLFFADWYEIEFEKLNNYYDRLNTAWEFDRLIDLCKNINLRMYFNLQNHEAFQWVGDFTSLWDWPAYNDVNNPQCYSWNTNDVGYCYNSELGVPTPEDFLTDSLAKKFFKYRLRYITSRWGYSTAISHFELRSETNNHAKYIDINYIQSTNKCEKALNHYAYYDNQNNFLQNITAWNGEMAQYIKTHQYFPHLFSLDYTGCPRKIQVNGVDRYFIQEGDESYYSPYVDLAAYNNYPGDIPISRFEGDVQDNIDLNHFDNPLNQTYATPVINKPIIIGESGYHIGQFCDKGIEYIKDLWVGTFTGRANAGSNWHYQQQYALVAHHTRLKDFIYGINFSNIIWTPQDDVREDFRAASYCLKSTENKIRAIGVIENRTLNYYTNGCQPFFDVDSTHFKYIPNPALAGSNTTYTNAQAFLEGSGDNRLMIEGMGYLLKYDIDWYDALTGQHLGFETQRSNFAARLRLSHPPLAGSMSGYSSNSAPIIAYKIRRHNEPSFVTEYDSIYASEDNLITELEEDKNILPEIETTNWEETKPTQQESSEITLSPNPATGTITVKFNSELINARLKITTLQNSVLYTSILAANSVDIDVSTFSPGSYLVVIENNGKLYFQKLVKQ